MDKTCNGVIEAQITTYKQKDKLKNRERMAVGKQVIFLGQTSQGHMLSVLPNGYPWFLFLTAVYDPKGQ